MFQGEVEDDDTCMYGDAIQLSQILYNLFTHAAAAVNRHRTTTTTRDDGEDDDVVVVVEYSISCIDRDVALARGWVTTTVVRAQKDAAAASESSPKTRPAVLSIALLNVRRRTTPSFGAVGISKGVRAENTENGLCLEVANILVQRTGGSLQWRSDGNSRSSTLTAYVVVGTDP